MNNKQNTSLLSGVELVIVHENGPGIDWMTGDLSNCFVWSLEVAASWGFLNQNGRKGREEVQDRTG